MVETRGKENVIEWLTGQDVIALTLNQQKYINKIRKLKKKHPKQVKIHTNKDGSIFAKIPLSALKLNIIEREKVELDEEQRKEIGKRLQKGKKAKAQDSDWD